MYEKKIFISIIFRLTWPQTHLILAELRIISQSWQTLKFDRDRGEQPPCGSDCRGLKSVPDLAQPISA